MMVFGIHSTVSEGLSLFWQWDGFASALAVGGDSDGGSGGGGGGSPPQGADVVMIAHHSSV